MPVETPPAAPVRGDEGRVSSEASDGGGVPAPLSRRVLRERAHAAMPGTSSSHTAADPFLAAVRAFPGFSEAAPPVSPAVSVSQLDAPTAESLPLVEGTPPGRRSLVRRFLAAGATVGIMGIAGLLAISITLPAGAVAAGQGTLAVSTTSLLAAEDEETSTTLTDEEIQAFVASSEVQNDALEHAAEGFSTESFADIAAAEGIDYSNALYTNDPDAAIQWPFIVGVAMSSGFGMRNGRMHDGIDLVPGAGAPIQAIADGTVRIATEAGGAYGVTVYVDHVIDGQVVTSHYSHMQYGSLRVTEGDTVKVGDIVGLVGNTGRSYGAHLHFEIIIDGATIDPLPWLQANAGRDSLGDDVEDSAEEDAVSP